MRLRLQSSSRTCYKTHCLPRGGHFTAERLIVIVIDIIVQAYIHRLGEKVEEISQHTFLFFTVWKPAQFWAAVDWNGSGSARRLHSANLRRAMLTCGSAACRGVTCVRGQQPTTGPYPPNSRECSENVAISPFLVSQYLWPRNTAS